MISTITRRRFITSLSAFGVVPFLPKMPMRDAADIIFPSPMGSNPECHVCYMSPIYVGLSDAQRMEIEEHIAYIYGIELDGK